MARERTAPRRSDVGHRGPRWWAAARLLLILPGALVLGAGCGEDEAPPPPSASSGAVILRFQAEPTSLFPGERATLRWEVRDAITLGIETEDGEAIALDGAALEARSLEVAPEETTRYELVAIGRDRRAVRKGLTITLRPPKPEILSFATSSAEIEAGQSLQLSWATEGAESIRLLVQGGGEVDVRGASPADGSVSVKPAADTTYTLEATNPSGKATAAVSVRVVDPLDLEFYAHRPTITWGEATLLDWRTRSAQRVVLRTADEVLVDRSDAPSGKLEVEPRRTITYRFTAHGQTGSKELSAEVRVVAGIDTFQAEVEGALPRGQPIELSWETRGAETLAIHAAGGIVYEIEGEARAAGSAVLPVPQDGRFVLVATTVDGLETSRELQLPLLEGAEILALEISPASLTLEPGQLGEVELRWFTHLATGVEIARVGAGIVHAADVEVQEGSATLAVDRSSTFAFTARNAAGADSRSIEVEVVLPPTIESFAAAPSLVGVGETFQLVWDAPNASSIELFQGPARIHTSSEAQGSFSYQIAVDSTFRLVATNRLGQVAESSLTVSVGAPQISTFTLSPDRVAPTSQLGFTWTNLGGTSLQVVGPSGPIAACSTTDLARVASGGCSATAPESLGSHDYELILRNDIGQTARAIRTVTVADGPAIVSFTVDQSLITLGDPLTFYWETGPDADGVIPTLAITDAPEDYGLAGADPLQGSITLTPLRTGTRTFTLTASTPGTAAARWELEVMVFALPTLRVAASSETYFPGEGPVELSWESTAAVGISIQELDEEGEPLEIAFFADPARVAAGSYGVLPPAPGRTYRILALNAAGASVKHEVALSWHQPLVVDFSAAPADVSLGDAAYLLWETIRSEEVSIAPRPVVLSAPFEDVSQSAAAARVELGACGAASVITDGCAPIDLPVPFPFGGVSRSSARVYLNGVLSFDVDREGPSSSNAQLPAPASFAHLAPFWQPLAASVPDGGERRGTIYVAQGADERGDFSVIQWAGFWVPGASASQPVDLNFQVVLYATGDFDFRYGRMEGAPPLEGAASGGEASIGYQLPGGADGQSISFREAVAIGLGDRSLGLRFAPLPTSGTLEILPLHEGENAFTLTATSGTGSAIAEARVHTHTGVSLSGVTASHEFPAPGEAFEIRWNAPGAAVVRVERPKLDEEDEEEEAVVLCSHGGGGPGACTLTEQTAGVYRYVVRALGPGFGDEALGEIELPIFPPFSIDAFAAVAFVEPGEEEEDVVLIEISWTTTNVASIALEEDGVPLDTSGLGVDQGELIRPYHPGRSYTLTATSAGRVRRQTTTVIDPDESGEAD